jgi:hypothetical protein
MFKVVILSIDAYTFRALFRRARVCPEPDEHTRGITQRIYGVLHFFVFVVPRSGRRRRRIFILRVLSDVASPLGVRAQEGLERGAAEKEEEVVVIVVIDRGAGRRRLGPPTASRGVGRVRLRGRGAGDQEQWGLHEQVLLVWFLQRRPGKGKKVGTEVRVSIIKTCFNLRPTIIFIYIKLRAHLQT